MKKTNLHTLLVLVLLLLCCHVEAAQWIDLTEDYVVNPSFAGNDISTGWMGTPFGAATPKENAEHYEKNFDTYQYIYGLTPGKYRVSVDAFYRMGDSGNDYSLYRSGNYASYQYAQLYATSDSEDAYVPIIPASSGALSYSLGGTTSTVGSARTGGVQYIPNNMEAAYYWFQAGYYDNSVEVTVGDNGVLRIGVRKQTTISKDWMCLDNWKLEYYGEIVNVTSITLNKRSSSLVSGETVQLTATLLPENATIKRLTWTSSDKNVATVNANGLVRALKEGTTTITCTANDGSNTKATCTITVIGNGTRLSKLVITEIQSANIDQQVDPSWNYGGWVELYNGSALSVSLTGCWVSNDPKNLKQVRLSEPTAIKAKSYHALWFEHHDKYCPSQVDAKLNVEGDSLYISDPSGTLIASLIYPPAISRCSYARKSLSSDEWGWSDTPTPGEANDGMSYATEQLMEPEVDQPTQIFGSTLNVCVYIPEGTTLRYTTDGSTPTSTNGQISYDGLFYPSETTTYRFRLFGDGYLPSPVVTRTYIYEDKTFDLPVISVVGDSHNLYSDEMGILVRGNNGRPGNGQSSPCNWNMDWERPVNFEFLNQEGEMVINQETAMERCGGWSRAWTPYSFKLKANKRYELQNYLPYQFFPEKPYLKHKTLQIRNGGNDTQCRIKDPALQEIIRRSGLDIDYQAYQPVMHYINGQYAGVINMREPNNKHFVYANYGLDEEEIDQFEMSPDSGYVQKCGTYESMQRWYDLARQCGNDDDAYEQIKQMVDIDEFCNYMAVEFYLGGTDWPQNNVKAFKPITEGGRFRFILYDLDGAFSTTSSFSAFAGKKNYTFDRLYDEPVTNITKEIELVTIFLNMIKNPSFCKQFIDTYCLVTGSVFEPERCKSIINELANRVSESQNIFNYVYWQSSTPWNTANSLISSLSTSRQSTMINTLRNYAAFGLSNKTSQNISLSTDTKEARLLVNGLPVPTNKFSGQLFSPITLKAQAPAGFRFEGWKLISGNIGNTTTILPKESTWQYYDQGSLDGENWTSTNYNTSAWQSGQAPLGYFVGGNRYTNTYINYGNNSSQKYPTYYFRTTLTLNETPRQDDSFTLNYSIDDGFVVYVNGTEAGRYNMPNGTVTFNTYATSYAHNNPDTGTLPLDASLFRKGQNVIAVEIHNNSATSSDIYWEGEVVYSISATEGEIVCIDEEYQIPTSGNMQLQACYTPMSEEEKEEEGLVTTPIVINEVSAGNSIYVNEYYKKDDWVELYNTTDEDYDLEGMYITDKSKNLTKCRITADGMDVSTIIPAHGYKIIWCSKRWTNSELHVDFKLENADGEYVRIMAADQSWADSLVYCAHNGDQTVGRYPDGSKDVFLMTQPTIAKSNQLNTYATLWEYVNPVDPQDAVESVMASREGGLSVAYAGEQLLVKSEDSPHVMVSIYTPAGARVMSQSLNLEGMHERVSVSSLPSGIYIARASDSEGNECATKFAKK